jgi:spermidine synthase/MFS family permease
MQAKIGKTSILLFCSGLCALIYQMAWLRQLRLVFGASTAASAAVLAIFMAGLGVGSTFLGKRADKSNNPLLLYSNLEFLIAIAAAISPFLIFLIRTIYLASGGSLALGLPAATVLRLALSALVLGIPTFMMGGTLPAAARAVTSSADASRRYLAVLYGFNTLGAVIGAALSTFYLLEVFGVRNTLWLACLLNFLVAFTARNMAKMDEQSPPESESIEKSATFTQQNMTADSGLATSFDKIPTGFVLASAGVVGFAFFLMELVWYRMLGSLLGGSTYTFGLILVIALLGIGLGGAAYALFFRKGEATLAKFSLTCGLEALFLALPYALGDRLALLAALLKDLGAIGFYGDVMTWTVIALMVIFPAAFISGIQFPLLIALLGKGREGLGNQTGQAYACNTLGAILGSLAGGFGALPLLTAPGSWCVAVFILAGLGALALVLSLRETGGTGRLFWPALAIFLAALLLKTQGPTAAWRHSPIGAGRVNLSGFTKNGLKKFLHERRRQIIWERDGSESAVALSAYEGLSFIVNGKVDGNARGDASTQVMLGMLGAVLHPDPKKAIVIGLGTGSSAGWLADIPTMERVDVVELEPEIAEVARRCAAVNRNVLQNPKARLIYADAREILLTAPEQYDLILSEPSNPYRAGIASLYTAEFYRSARKRLAPGGLFVQWVQAYEVDTATIRTIIATLRSEFASVESWQTNPTDMLLVCTDTPRACDLALLSQKIQTEPYRSALRYAWKAADAEGVLAHYVAGDSLAREIYEQEKDRLNTDDRMLVEYGFARTVGRGLAFSLADMRETAFKRGAHLPQFVATQPDAASVEDQYLEMYVLEQKVMPLLERYTQAQRVRAASLLQYLKNGDVLDVWARQEKELLRPAKFQLELSILADSLAAAGKESAALSALAKLDFPIEAAVVTARLHFAKKEYPAAAQSLQTALVQYRDNPWPWEPLMKKALVLAGEIARADHASAPGLLEAVSQPFAVYQLENDRLETKLELAALIDVEQGAKAVAEFEPWIPWEKPFLLYRATSYHATGNPAAQAAIGDWLRFAADEPVTFTEALDGMADSAEAYRRGE